MSRGSKNEKNYVSVGSWMLIMFLLGIPVVNLIAVLVLAFAGENETRKNYFKAILMWIVVSFAIVGLLIAAGAFPQIMKHLENLRHRI